MRYCHKVILLVLVTVSCNKTTTLIQQPVTPGSTSEVSIYYRNYFAPAEQKPGQYIFLLQNGTVMPAAYSHKIYLSSKGGTVRTAEKSAYSYSFRHKTHDGSAFSEYTDGLPSWLKLSENDYFYYLEPDSSEPSVVSLTGLEITSTSDEGKSTTIETTLAVLFNEQAATTKPNMSNAYSGSGLAVEEGSSDDDNDNSGSSDINGSCDHISGNYQSIIPGQTITATAGAYGKDCYAFYVPADDIRISFSITSLASNDQISTCSGDSTNVKCSYIISFDRFSADKSSDSMASRTEDTGLYLMTPNTMYDLNKYTVPMYGNSLINAEFDQVNMNPPAWRWSFRFTESNALASNTAMSINNSEKCNPQTDTSGWCKKDTDNNQVYLGKGWYFFVVQTKKADVASTFNLQPYSIKLEYDLN